MNIATLVMEAVIQEKQFKSDFLHRVYKSPLIKITDLRDGWGRPGGAHILGLIEAHAHAPGIVLILTEIAKILQIIPFLHL